MSIKSRFLGLVNEIKKEDKESKDELLEFLKERMDKLGIYVHNVYMMEYSQPIFYARYEGEELRDKIKALDSSRRIAHEAAIAAVSQINRLCSTYQVDPLYEGDEADRWMVAEFCEAAVHDFFKKRSLARTASIREYVERAQNNFEEENQVCE